MISSDLVAIVPAPRLDSYPHPTQSAQWGLRIEDCACGGMVALRPGEPVTRVVRAHQSTPIHAAWRLAREAYDAGDGVSITPTYEQGRLPLTPVAVGPARLRGVSA